MRQLVRLTLMMLSTFSMAGLHADAALVKRPEVQQFIKQMVGQHGFKQQEIVAYLKAAEFQPKIIESMERPYEKKSWDVYRDLFLTQNRLEAGIQFWQANQAALEQAQKKYGVPASVIVAILGVETLYGKRQGEYRVLDALTTLAFDYPKRAPFFTKELAEYFLLCREQGVAPTQYIGSYAGAIGQPQFMPSSYRFYAVNGTGKRGIDLVNQNEDVIASVANYFHKHGWKTNQLVAKPANIVGSQYKKIQVNSRQPNYTYRQLRALGVRSDSAKAMQKAGLIELATNRGEEYWIAYPNFYVITRYNSSPQYALVVYLLSQQLQNRWVALHGNKKPSYV